MKALSITRPWPELILRCGKSVENRTWKTSYRGPILLHAAQSWAVNARPFAEYVELALGRDLGVSAVARKASEHPTGIVGVADLVDVCSAEMAPAHGRVADPGWPCSCGPWAMAAQHHWRLANVRRFAEPVPCRGALGLWTVPNEAPDFVAAAVAAQLPAEVNRA